MDITVNAGVFINQNEKSTEGRSGAGYTDGNLMTEESEVCFTMQKGKSHRICIGFSSNIHRIGNIVFYRQQELENKQRMILGFKLWMFRVKG